MKHVLIFAAFCISGCNRPENAGDTPSFSAVEGSYEHHAMYATPLSDDVPVGRTSDGSSLWQDGRKSLFGERRATLRGDILTVVIEIDDKAEITNSSDRARSGSETVKIPSLLGIPERLNSVLPEGASLASAVSTSSESDFRGEGSVARKEKLTLRIAATVVEELPNGVLRIEGQQEVRVNYELRELIVSGFVRPLDISRKNEITYDKIAGARIAYGGRGQISEVQQPRYGQRFIEKISPF